LRRGGICTDSTADDETQALAQPIALSIGTNLLTNFNESTHSRPGRVANASDRPNGHPFTAIDAPKDSTDCGPVILFKPNQR
jgi:hypothetical protein